METMDPRADQRPVLDMTPEGEFRDPAPRQATWLDRALARLGGVAVLVALVAAGVVVAGIAVAFLALALPVAVVAGLVAFGSLWWHARRGTARGRSFTFVMRR
ncbi:hypothetical protein QMO56_04140 [Roseomonas sp. E05]|uniref:hypothetical protein n=1 Tax=Roseomonas sp. E05 TaxID=3046310 RepID=UPI0024B9F9B7|nr:hypothetical protein [Roseomonas sp. E05]MDJ0387296.1 hypothetical protein [Roseomonas sp. E05]